MDMVHFLKIIEANEDKEATVENLHTVTDGWLPYERLRILAWEL